MVKLKVKAITVGNSVRVALPTEILSAASVGSGDTLLIDYDTKTRLITLEKASRED